MSQIGAIRGHRCTRNKTISPDIFVVIRPRRSYSLQGGVVQLKLVTSGRGRSKPVVGPEGAKSVGHKRQQFLVISKTLTAGEDGAGVHL